MVNCDHLSTLDEAHDLYRKGVGQRRKNPGATSLAVAEFLLFEAFLRSDPCSIHWPRRRTKPQRNLYFVRELRRTPSQRKNQRSRGLLISLTPTNLPRPSLIGPTPRSRGWENLLTSHTKVYRHRKRKRIIPKQQRNALSIKEVVGSSSSTCF